MIISLVQLRSIDISSVIPQMNGRAIPSSYCLAAFAGKSKNKRNHSVSGTPKLGFTVQFSDFTHREVMDEKLPDK
ncbi:hypothetical protein AVEN_134373-1 [Araneus ventricosus]|uniref:Uncharacterized protein n=1 Tax=Araneus ventricosus TaxID=182803 RepID=A0A4Y2NEI6_ARAVE|nr:hypothetical protein AVEN_134373-1 [Araneus ventricosus]